MSVAIVATLLAARTAYGAPAVIAGVELHSSPFEILQHIDCGLSGSSGRALDDMAAAMFTGCAVIPALREQADAGVRLLFDGGELAELRRCTPGHPPGQAARAPNIEIKIEPPAAQMHLKAYAIDGEVLRFGSANFSPSGLKHQGNELAIVRDRDTTQRFEKIFEALWSRSDNTSWRGK